MLALLDMLRLLTSSQKACIYSYYTNSRLSQPLFSLYSLHSTPLLPPTSRPSSLSRSMSSSPRNIAAKARPSQGQLTEDALSRLSEQRTFPSVIDIGANICDKSFDKDRQQVLERAGKAGLESIIITGSCLRTTIAARDLSHSTENSTDNRVPLYFTAGCHPHNAKHATESTFKELKMLAMDPNCVAVGECGLDFNRNFSPPDVQEEIFAQQIKLAEEVQKPLFMHSRDASDRFYAILE